MSSPRELVAELVHRYADAVVHKDQERWAACWADDAHWYLSEGRTATGKPAIVKHWVESMAAIDLVVQNVFTGEVRFTEDTAAGRWYIVEHVRRGNGDVNLLLAYYDDTYVCIDGAWLFNSRRLTKLYHGLPDLSGSFTPPPGTTV